MEIWGRFFEARFGRSKLSIFYTVTSDILFDAIRLEKNVILLKSLNLFDANALDGKNEVFIDVWPIDILKSDFNGHELNFDFDESSLFLLQLAALLSRSAS